MKKIFILLLSVVALLAFSTSSFALHAVKDMFEYTPQIVKSKKAMLEIGGHIRVRGELADNNSDFRDRDDQLGVGDDEKASYDARVNLMVTATVSPNSKGVIELQSASYSDGGTDSYGWGNCQDAQGTYEGAGNCKPANIDLRQAYIAHQGTGLLGTMSGFKVGHMPIALGTGIYYNHTEFGDDAIVLWTQPMDGTEVAFAIIKGDEKGGVSGGSADDVDIYALTFETALSGINISGDLSYLNDNSWTGTSTSATGGDFAEGLNLWNLGLRGNVDVSGINISADVEIQNGKVEKLKTSNNADLDLRGWATEVKASTKVGDIGVHAGVGYGSGDKKDTADKFEGFMNSLGNGQDFTYLYDQKAKTSSQAASAGTNSSTYANTTRTGLANTLYINAGASTNVNPDINVAADVYWLRASQKVAETTTTSSDKKDIGVEVDGKVTYQIDTNLVWYVEAGYLFAGDFYKNVTMDNKSPDDAYSVRHGVVLTF